MELQPLPQAVGDSLSQMRGNVPWAARIEQDQEADLVSLGAKPLGDLPRYQAAERQTTHEVRAVGLDVLQIRDVSGRHFFYTCFDRPVFLEVDPLQSIHRLIGAKVTGEALIRET